MNMKKLYENPRLLAYEYAVEEVLSTSITETGDNNEEWNDF